MKLNLIFAVMKRQLVIMHLEKQELDFVLVSEINYVSRRVIYCIYYVTVVILPMISLTVLFEYFYRYANCCDN